MFLTRVLFSRVFRLRLALRFPKAPTCGWMFLAQLFIAGLLMATLTNGQGNVVKRVLGNKSSHLKPQ